MIKETEKVEGVLGRDNGRPSFPELEVMPSVNEQLQPRRELIIEVGDVTTKGNPEYEQVPCLSCDDEMMVYSCGELSVLRFGEHLKVSQIWAYRCNNESCDFFAVLPEVEADLRQHIAKTPAKPFPRSSA